MITKCGFQIETYIPESKNLDPNLKSMNVDFRKELQVIVPLQSVPENQEEIQIGKSWFRENQESQHLFF